MLASLEPQLGVVQQHALVDLDVPVLELEHHPTAALGRLERELERRPVGRGRAGLIQPIHLGQLLGPRLRLPGPRPGPEPGYEPLESLDLGLLALDRATERQIAGRLLA